MSSRPTAAADPMKPRPMRTAGGAFRPLHEAAVGLSIDWSAMDLSGFSEDLLEHARRVWSHRVQTEFRSVQIMTRFLQEVLGAGDPVDVYAWAADLVQDEVRHTALCREACLALGGAPAFPEPAVPPLAEAYRRAPMADRALTTAISMLAINETISAAFIEDLAARCSTPGLSDVLSAIIADEEGHGALGWAYVEASLARYEAATLPSWRHLVATTLAPHRQSAERAAARPAEDEASYAALGLFTPARQAAVYRRAFEKRVEPQLRRLGLLG